MDFFFRFGGDLGGITGLDVSCFLCAVTVFLETFAPDDMPQKRFHQVSGLEWGQGLYRDVRDMEITCISRVCVGGTDKTVARRPGKGEMTYFECEGWKRGGGNERTPTFQTIGKNG